MTQPDDHKPGSSDNQSTSPAEQSPPGPSWSGYSSSHRSSYLWDQPPITEVTPAGGAHEPGWEPVGPAAPSSYPAAGGPVIGQPGYPGYPMDGEPGYPAGQPGYPAGQPGYPSGQPGYPAGQPGYPMVGQPIPEPARRRLHGRLSWILGAAVAVLLLLVGGGAVAAYQVLNGGGAQPDQVVPANAIAFAKLDLNPSASQKIAAARFLHRIPKLGAGFTGSRDWRQAMFQALASDDQVPDGVNYDRDVKPWLGKRAALAVLPTKTGPDGDPDVLLAFQSTDDNKARAGIARFGSDNGVAFYRGYAVVAQTQQIADKAVADAKAAALADSEHYRADSQQLGSLGIASGWADLGALSKLAGSDGIPSSLFEAGRFAFTVRLTADSADLISKLYGFSSVSGTVPSPDIGDLPATSAVALGLGTTAISNQSSQYLLGMLGLFGTDDPSENLGLNMPEDMRTLLGTGLTAAVSADGITSGSTVKFAVRSRTDGAAAARVMDTIKAAVQDSDAGFGLTYQATPSGLLLANDEGYLAEVGSGKSPSLSGLASFRQALPERAGATELAFVNLDAIAKDLRAHGGSSEALDTISAFSAVGLTIHTSGSSATLHVRLLAH